MALVVEDGTGLTTANTYLTVATADAYHVEICNDGWSGGTVAKEAALIRATRFVDRLDFLGQRSELGDGLASVLPQALQWPRDGVTHPEGFIVDPNAVPIEVVRATAEVALAVLVFGGQLNPATGPEGRITEELEKVGRTWVQTKFQGGGASGPVGVPEAFTLLQPLLALGVNRRLVRA